MITKYFTLTVLSFYFGIIILCSGCATKQVMQPSAPGAQLAHAPKMLVGDSWIVTGYSDKYESDTYTEKVIAVGSDKDYTLEIKSEKGNRTEICTYNSNGQSVQPPSKARKIDFPLFVGKEWSDSYYGRSVSGVSYNYKNKYVVKNYETVLTKAGPLKAFKIKQVQTVLVSGYRGLNEYWYSPEAKTIVKEKPSWRKGRELISYKLAQPDTEPPTIEITAPGLQRGIAIVKTAKQTEIRGFVRDDSSVKWLKINQKEVTLNDAGRFSYVATLSEGANPFEVQASDVHGNEANKLFNIDYIMTEAPPPHKVETLASLAKPACWVLSIGVSIYENKQLSLRYADNDAEAIGTMLKDQEGKLFSEVFVKTLANEQCTRANIMESLTSHLGKAGPDDVVFVFVAGHGIRHKQTGSYYFLTYNADAKSLIYEGLKWSDFEEAIKIMSKNVNKVVLALDTCHAGSMKTYMRGVDGGEDLALALKQASGLYILASSKAGEESIEGEHFKLPFEKEGHGAFTYALLKGLSGEANVDTDSHVTVYELFKYVAKLVPRITEGRQHPYSRTTGTDMPIAAFKE